jgi:hypothetical protein
LITLFDLAKEMWETYAPEGPDWDDLPNQEAERWVLVANAARSYVMAGREKEIENLKFMLDSMLET